MAISKRWNWLECFVKERRERTERRVKFHASYLLALSSCMFCIPIFLFIWVQMEQMADINMQNGFIYKCSLKFNMAFSQNHQITQGIMLVNFCMLLLSITQKTEHYHWQKLHYWQKPNLKDWQAVSCFYYNTNKNLAANS
jgi:hypothetical protein